MIWTFVVIVALVFMISGCFIAKFLIDEFIHECLHRAWIHDLIATQEKCGHEKRS